MTRPKETPIADGEAVRRVRDGDRDAYRVLVERHAPLVFAVVRRYCRDTAQAEDLAQEVFLKAYEALDSYRGDARFSSWLYRIALNRCRDWAKSPRRTERSLEALSESGAAIGTGDGVEGLDGGEVAPQTPETPEEALERGERAALLRRALEELAPDYAVPLLLKYEQDLSYAEMAERLDATAGALKVRVHRARARLRKLLEDRI